MGTAFATWPRHIRRTCAILALENILAGSESEWPTANSKWLIVMANGLKALVCLVGHWTR